MTTPTKSHYFFAENGPFRICLAVVLLLCVAVALWACEPRIEVLRDWDALRTLAWAVLLAMALGWCSAVLIGWLLLGPFYYERAVKNGAPFEIGDRVQILSKPHRGRVSRVYALWQASQVRVELGEKEKRKLRDIFSPIQLLKERGEETPSESPSILRDGCAQG